MKIYTIEVRKKWEWIRFGAPKQWGCSTLVRESRYQGWTNMAND